MTTDSSSAARPYVFVVDDDQDVREALMMLLEMRGYRTRGVANGREALERLRSGDPPCVILLDLMMPVMDGWRFRAEQVRDPSLSQIPVVVLTGAATIHRQAHAALAPYALFCKPVDTNQLISVVERLCRQADADR